MYWKALSLSTLALASITSGAPFDGTNSDSHLEARQGIPPGNACGPVRRETRLVGDGDPFQDYYWEQMSDNINCNGGTCSIGEEQVETKEISASFAPGGEGWTAGEFSVSRSRSMGSVQTCGPDTGHHTVCMWYLMVHTGYQVQNFRTQQTSTSCSNWIEDGDQHFIRAPNDYNCNPGGWVCKFDDECKAEGSNYWEEAVSRGGPPDAGC